MVAYRSSGESAVFGSPSVTNLRTRICGVTERYSFTEHALGSNACHPGSPHLHDEPLPGRWHPVKAGSREAGARNAREPLPNAAGLAPWRQQMMMLSTSIAPWGYHSSNPRFRPKLPSMPPALRTTSVTLLADAIWSSRITGSSPLLAGYPHWRDETAAIALFKSRPTSVGRRKPR
jgi:hypothetical protein